MQPWRTHRRLSPQRRIGIDLTVVFLWISVTMIRMVPSKITMKLLPWLKDQVVLPMLSRWRRGYCKVAVEWIERMFQKWAYPRRPSRKHPNFRPRGKNHPTNTHEPSTIHSINHHRISVTPKTNHEDGVRIIAVLHRRNDPPPRRPQSWITLRSHLTQGPRPRHQRGSDSPKLQRFRRHQRVQYHQCMFHSFGERLVVRVEIYHHPLICTRTC